MNNINIKNYDENKLIVIHNGKMIYDWNEYGEPMRWINTRKFIISSMTLLVFIITLISCHIGYVKFSHWVDRQVKIVEIEK